MNDDNDELSYIRTLSARRRSTLLLQISNRIFDVDSDLVPSLGVAILLERERERER